MQNIAIYLTNLEVSIVDIFIVHQILNSVTIAFNSLKIIYNTQKERVKSEKGRPHLGTY